MLNLQAQEMLLEAGYSPEVVSVLDYCVCGSGEVAVYRLHGAQVCGSCWAREMGCECEEMECEC